jgi:uncharacterized protein YkwD
MGLGGSPRTFYSGKGARSGQDGGQRAADTGWVPKLRLACALVLVALAALGWLGPAAAATPDEQARIIELTNQARAASGLPALSPNAALTASAEAYSLAMATGDFFSHTGLDGSTFSARNQAAGYSGWSWMAENIAAGQRSADEVFTAWMNSPGHRANILNPQAREIGLGHAYGPVSTYKHYWTMELGARAGAPTAPTATPTQPAPTATPAPPTPTATPAAPSPTPTAAAPSPTATVAAPSPTATPGPPAPTAPGPPVGAAGRYRLRLPAIIR